jgi:hypothetical protein
MRRFNPIEQAQLRRYRYMAPRPVSVMRATVVRARVTSDARRQYERSLDAECTPSHDLLDAHLEQGP